MDRIGRVLRCCKSCLIVAFLLFGVGTRRIIAAQMSKQGPVSRSGRFESGPSAEVARFTESISFDWRLWEQDIRGSLAHAKMLKKIGILSATELKDITAGLTEIANEIRAGKFQWK